MDGGVGHDANIITVPIDTGVVPHDTGSVVPHDTGSVVPRDTGAPRVDGGTCAASCTTSTQCTSACGAVPGGGIRCCDAVMGTCFVSHTTSCPTAGHDAGSGGTSY